jgi:hypothetical protein
MMLVLSSPSAFFMSRGMKKVSVFPDPVGEQAMVSFPAYRACAILIWNRHVHLLKARWTRARMSSGRKSSDGSAGITACLMKRKALHI